MFIPNDKVINDIVPARLSPLGKKITGAHTFVRLGATELAALSTASTTNLYYGKFICVGLTQDFVASYNTTTEWTSASGNDATGGLVGTFYDVMWNKITSTSPTQGTIYFVGIQFTVANV